MWVIGRASAGNAIAFRGRSLVFGLAAVMGTTLGYLGMAEHNLMRAVESKFHIGAGMSDTCHASAAPERASKATQRPEKGLGAQGL